MNECKITDFYSTKDVICSVYKCITDWETEYKYLKLKDDKYVGYKKDRTSNIKCAWGNKELTHKWKILKGLKLTK